MRDKDAIIEDVTQRFPSATVEQLQVTHPGADDDGLWYFGLPGSDGDIQIESWDGMCPFLIESRQTPERRTGRTVEQVVNIICDHLATLSLA
jgi:hypothetical protein